MEPLFYSTGQVARQLGTTQAAVRTLCESGVMASETTRGGHLRIPESEVKRFKRDGLPPIPRPLPTESTPPARNGTAQLQEHSDSSGDCFGVQSALDEVAITRSVLEKRRIDREIEENEDWFVERQRQKDAAQAVERQKSEAKRAEQRRERWVEQWIQYALNSIPFDARREVEIEVHAAVATVLSRLQPSEPATITESLVEAAVHQALRPWTRKREIERALDAAINKLPWSVRNSRPYAPLKQLAWDAAAEVLGRLREEASYREMETVAVQAVQPMIRQHEHEQDCERMLGYIYLFDATLEEQEAAKEAARKALAALPIGAETKDLEKTLQAAVAPYKAAVAESKEKARLESEKEAQRRAAERNADLQLGHIERYLQQEYEFKGGYLEMRDEAGRLRPLIRATLIDALTRNPNMTTDQMRTSIEEQIDDGV